MLGELDRIERDQLDINVVGFQFSFVFAQLRNMFATWRSAEMSVKQQNQPTSLTVRKSMDLAFAILDFKLNRFIHACLDGLTFQQEAIGLETLKLSWCFRVGKERCNFTLV